MCCWAQSKYVIGGSEYVAGGSKYAAGGNKYVATGSKYVVGRNKCCQGQQICGWGVTNMLPTTAEATNMLPEGGNLVLLTADMVPGVVNMLMGATNSLPKGSK